MRPPSTSETYDFYEGDEQPTPSAERRETPEGPEHTPLTPPSGPRISPRLDPLRRRRLSNLVKWVFVVGILCLVYYAAARLYPDFLAAHEQANTGKSDPALVATQESYYIASVTVITIYATIIAMFLARLIARPLFAWWREAVEALRDWMVAGLVTGLIYYVAVNALKASSYGPHDPDSFNLWLQYRCPAMSVAAVIGLLLAGLISIYRDPRRDVGVFIGRILVQVVCLDLIWYGLQNTFNGLFKDLPALAPITLSVGVLCIISSIGMLIWAAQQDRGIDQLQREGIRARPGEVELTITVIGGRESGKTMFLLGTYYQWNNRAMGRIQIRPANDAANTLAEDVRLLYTYPYQLPNRTVISTQYTFDLMFEDGQPQRVARFRYLDYPGGAVRGNAVSAAVTGFLEQVDRTDALILIVDMSYVRRGRKEQDWFHVRDAYNEAIDRILRRNGPTRVVPVCFVLTKCDEYANADGEIDRERVMREFRDFGYGELEQQWIEKSKNLGPGFAVQSVFTTSAIRYSTPALVNGVPDYSLPFPLRQPPPPAITPVRCAAPLLWLCAKTMRFNVTLAWDIQTMFFGSSAVQRRQEDAIDELEEQVRRLSRS